jgi:hypothetical protein
MVLLTVTDRDSGYQTHGRFVDNMSITNRNMESHIRLPAAQLREYEFENKLTPRRGQLIIEKHITPGLSFEVIVSLIITQSCRH